MTNNPALKEKHQAVLLQAQAAGALYLSTISVWEVARLESSRETFTAGGVESWVQHSFRAGGLRRIELSMEVLIESTRLPGNIHGDPADRMLAACARIGGHKLVTHDDLLLKYGREGHLQVHKV